MKYYLIIFLCIPLILNSAAFEDIGIPRARGMGEAFEGMQEGVESILYNPAGAITLKGVEAISMFGKPATGFDDETSMNVILFASGVPFTRKPYLLPLQYLFKGLTIGHERWVIEHASFSFLFHQFYVSQFAYERLFLFNLAKDLKKTFDFIPVGIGVNLKIFNRGYEITEDLAVYPETGLNNSATGFGLDVGLNYDFSRNIKLGFAVENLIEPNISFFSGGKEYVNRRLKGGIAIYFGTVKPFGLVKLHSLILSGSFLQISRDVEDIRKAELTYKFGFEFFEPLTKKLDKQIGIRAGFQTYFNVLSLGFSFKYKLKNKHIFTLDYAFNFPFNSSISKHYIGLKYNLDFPDHYFDLRTEEDIKRENRRIEEEYKKGIIYLEHKVKPYESLYSISIYYYGSADYINYLKKVNEIEDERFIPSYIKIPFKAEEFKLYKVKEGDTLENIANRFYGNPRKAGYIRKYNKIEFSRLRPGRILLLPKKGMKEKEETKEKGKKKVKKRKKRK